MNDDEPRKCKLGRLLEQMSDNDRGVIETALERSDITTARITAVVSDRHERLSEGVVARHRNRVLRRAGHLKCGCPVDEVEHRK